MKKFSVRLKKCRERKKNENPIWTQGYIAEKIGVARVTYTAYENGTKQPPLDTVNSIADILNVSTDYLLGRIENPVPTKEVTVAGRENKFKADEEFEAFANDPELERWYKELPKSKEDDLQALKQMWEIIKKNKK